MDDKAANEGKISDRASASESGIKVVIANGWFAAWPTGTEDIYKICAESPRDKAHPNRSRRKRKKSLTPRAGRYLIDAAGQAIGIQPGVRTKY